MDYEALKEKIDEVLEEYLLGNDPDNRPDVYVCGFIEGLSESIIGIIRTQEKNMPVIDEENMDDFFSSSGETLYGFLR